MSARWHSRSSVFGRPTIPIFVALTLCGCVDPNGPAAPNHRIFAPARDVIYTTSAQSLGIVGSLGGMSADTRGENVNGEIAGDVWSGGTGAGVWRTRSGDLEVLTAITGWAGVPYFAGIDDGNVVTVTGGGPNGGSVARWLTDGTVQDLGWPSPCANGVYGGSYGTRQNGVSGAGAFWALVSYGGSCPAGVQHVALWTPASGWTSDIPLPTGSVNGQVMGVSSHATFGAVGYYPADGGSSHAALVSSAGGFQDLGLPAGEAGIIPKDVNENGWVVGISQSFYGTIWLWTPQNGFTVINGNASWPLLNDAGQIAYVKIVYGIPSVIALRQPNGAEAEITQARLLNGSIWNIVSGGVTWLGQGGEVLGTASVQDPVTLLEDGVQHPFVYMGGTTVQLLDDFGASGGGVAQNIDASGVIGGMVFSRETGIWSPARWRLPSSSSPPGYVGVGTNVQVSISPVQVTFGSVSSAGVLAVTSGQVGPSATAGAPPAPPSSNFRLGSPPLYYDISTTASFSGSATVCVTYPAGAFASTANLVLLHYGSTAWQRVPSETVDPASRTVCAQTTSFSPFMLAEIEQAPNVTQVHLTGNPVPINTATTLQASFSDANLGDTHTGGFSWAGGSGVGSITESNGSGTLILSQPFTATGVYTITATISDGDLSGSRSSSLDVPAYLVVYDPSAGFVTGGGWILSPPGAYAGDPSASGKASFGFVSKYQAGASVPTGNTQFVFSAASFTFKSTSYDWLVISGARAQYKGSGTVNGAGDYGFLLTAIDGAVSGGGGSDKFRIKVWDKGTGTVVYDNEVGTSDTSIPATVLGGGSITIHS